MKKFLKLASIIAGIILALLLVVAILAPTILKLNGPIDPSRHTGKFTKETLDRICGVELRQDDREIGKVKCKYYWNNRNVPTEFDDLRFYVFENNRSAKKAFNNIKKNYFTEIVDEGDDFVKGEEAGVVDASVVTYFYIHNNLIIKVDTEVYSEWAYNPDDPSTYPEPYIIDQDYLDELLRKNF